MKLIKPNTLPTTRATLSRASTATYVDDAGVLQTVAADVPRWENGRLLVEAAGTNVVTSPDLASPTLTGAGATKSTVNRLTPKGVLGNCTEVVTGTVSVGCRFGLTTGGDTARDYGGSVWACTDTGTELVSVDVNNRTPVNFTLTTTWQRVAAVGAANGVDAFRFLDVVLPAGASGRKVYFAFAQVELDGVTSYMDGGSRAADVLTGSGLLYTSATEAAPAYAAGTTYAAGAQVQYARSLYQSLQASNTGHQPDTSPTWWARLGPANDWAMFDDQVSTQTQQATGPLRVALNTGAMDSLAVLGVNASTVRLVVQASSGGAVVYDQTQGMGAEAVTNWYDYFFSDPEFQRRQALFLGIPVYGGGVASLTFSSGSAVAVGHVACGRIKSVGGLRYGARAGIKDFSRKDTDDFGVTTFVRRANSKYLTSTLEVEKVAINQVHNLLTSLTATPVVWIGSEDVYYSDTLLVFGFFRDFYCSIDYPTLAIYSLEIEGLI